MDLFMLTFWLGLVVMAAVTAFLGWALWRYRRRPNQEGIPEQIHGEARLEALLTIAPAIILIFIGVPTVGVIFDQQKHVEPTPEDLHVRVVGYQWWWAFEYPELGIVTANELHIPTGRRVVLDLRTADVIHSLWVPRLAGKRDLIPNQDNQLWFIADEAGYYNGHCAEFCLTAHAYMRLRVIAHEEEEFGTWVASMQGAGAQQVAQQADPLELQGRQLFSSKGCAGCHAIRGISDTRIGPDLTNFGLRTTIAAGVLTNTPENLARWIRDPHEVKPGNYMPDLGLAEEEIAALVAYLESLGRDSGLERQAFVEAGGIDGNR
jgi:cytochrome c oxidase subunit 2